MAKSRVIALKKTLSKLDMILPTKPVCENPERVLFRIITLVRPNEFLFGYLIQPQSQIAHRRFQQGSQIGDRRLQQINQLAEQLRSTR
jgi:hypothetical protein